MGPLKVASLHWLKPTLAAFAFALVASSAAAQTTTLKFALPTPILGPSAPFVVAADRGFFRAEKLEVIVEGSASSTEAITRVVSGAYAMGLADINVLIKFRDQNPKTDIKAVFMLENRPAYAVIGRKSRDILAPKDLAGKKLGIPTTDPTAIAWPIFAKTSDIEAAKVNVLSIGAPVSEPMLASGEVDAITGISYMSFIDLKEKGVPVDDISILSMPDYGVALYGHAVIVDAKFAKANPDVVKGFLRGLVRGLRETVRSPGQAVESVLKFNDDAKKAVELERLRMNLRDNILTPEAATIGFGAIDGERFSTALDQLALAYKFKTKPNAAEIFDAAFLPSAAERHTN